MKISQIQEAVSQVIAERGCFLVEVKCTPDNDITVAIEKEGDDTVKIEDCEAVNDAFEAVFNRDEEDYSLTVTSAGLDQPLKVPAQFVKYRGKKVEVSIKGGKKVVATLLGSTEEGITISFTELVKEGKKKVKVEKEQTLAFKEVNRVLPYIEFE